MNKLEFNAGHLITGSYGQPLAKSHCDECGANVVASSQDAFCSFCGTKRVQAGTDKQEVSASAYELKDEAALTCASCKATIRTDYPKDKAADLAMAMFCPVCGSEDVGIADGAPESAKEEDNAAEDASNDEEVSDNLEEREDEQEEIADEGREAVEEKIDASVPVLSAADVVNLEAVYLELPEPQWVVFHAGEPLIRFRQSKQPEDAKRIFGSERYMDVVRNRISETSLASVIKELDAEVMKPEKIMTALEVDSMAYERLQAQVLPKFLDCMNLAIIGMAKNVYPDVNAELKAAFFDELDSRGVTDPMTVVEAAFETSGQKVFESLVAKAMELYNKPEEVKEELKATILATTSVRNSRPVTQDELDRRELKDKLVAGNLPLVETEPITKISASADFGGGAVDDIRSRIRLHK